MARMTHDEVTTLIANDTHAPHCWRGWVKGEGYVMDAQYALTHKCQTDYNAQLQRERQSLADNLQSADGYAEPGYTAPKAGILFADWNVVSREVSQALETAGFELEWSDEWGICDDCQRAVRTQPDGHSWRPVYHVTDDEIICRDCCQENAGQSADYDEDELG